MITNVFKSKGIICKLMMAMVIFIFNLSQAMANTFGLSYGYSAPISSRLNLDFNIGIGYLSGKYYKYYPDDGCYVWSATKHLRYFGPTKVSISLGWLIYKNKKGGWR